MFFPPPSLAASPTPSTVCAALDSLALRKARHMTAIAAIARTRSKSNLTTNSSPSPSSSPLLSSASLACESPDTFLLSQTMSETPSPLDSGSPPTQRSSASTQKERRRRIRHHKSRKGCFTCKKRRVKCDEEQPICGACAFRGDSCSYPTSVLSTSAVSRSPRRSRPAVDPLQPLDFRLEGSLAEISLHGQDINIADLRLLSRFMMHTSRTMSPHAKRKQIWEQVVPDIATKKEYLMHLLLALAGEHLLYEVHMSGSITAGINESQSALPAYDEHELQLEYHRVIQHHQRGLEGFRQALADISPDTAEYVFCGALLIVAIAFASISTRDQDCPGLGLGKQDDDQYPYIDWLHLVRGLTSIVQEHWLTLKLGRLRAMLFYIYANDDWKLAVPASSSAQFSRLKHAPQVFHVFVQGATQAIRMLRAFAATLFPGTASLDGKSISTSQHSDNEQASEAEDHPYDYTHAIGKLEEIYMRILYVLQFSRSERDCAPALEIQIDIEDSAVTSWPYMISNSFFDSLKSREQLRPAEGFSYAILAHFYVVSLLFPDVWYLNSGFRSEIEKILLLVNKLENHALSALMAWPMAVIAGS